ncbi:MAG: 16S rRNA (adenine(1518)-N(6)/adenine(1519)-N(6))-dimethyltransferase RsmA [Pseudomonadota bacterium]
MAGSSHQPRHQPRKRFGQNFLTDTGIIDRLVNAIGAKPDDHIVEIGPGLGALTGELVRTGCRLDAVELDRDLITPLLAAFSIHPQFKLHSADALQFDYESLRQADETLRIVGNLPYNISTPLIFHLLSYSSLVKDMHFMLQLEVVERLTATPGSKHWGRLGIMTQFRCDAELLFEVPPESFDPPPKVQSAIVRLTPLEETRIPAINEAALAKVVKAAFAQRRKTLRNNLKGLLDAPAIESCDIDPGCRAETLSLDEFSRLAQLIEL